MDDLTETKVEPTAQPQPQDDGGTVKFVPPPPDLPVFNFTEIPIDLIKPNPWQTRDTIDTDYIAELADSIEADGNDIDIDQVENVEAIDPDDTDVDAGR